MPPTEDPSADGADASGARRTMVTIGVNHALHDGYTDLIYVLLPVWQSEFGLGYAALALLRTLFSGAMASLQMPSTVLARYLGARAVLALGTLLSAGGYALAGASGGLVGLCIALAFAGAGSSTQHPLASAVIARTYGRGARGPLGVYNFTGDLGKATVPALVGLLLTYSDWRSVLWIIAALGAVVSFGVWLFLPQRNSGPSGEMAEAKGIVAPDPASKTGRSGFSLLVVIGMLDNAARGALLIYLPFLLEMKGAALTTIGLALSLIFVGGALGKAVCGWLGQRFGVTPTVILTEAGTAAAILAVIALPLAPTLVLLPLLGVMLNGTSSVLYGTVPELAPNGNVERAFALFYTFTLGGSAIAMPLVYGRLGDAVGPGWASVASAVTAFAVVPLAIALAPFLSAASNRRT